MLARSPVLRVPCEATAMQLQIPLDPSVHRRALLFHAGQGGVDADERERIGASRFGGLPLELVVLFPKLPRNRVDDTVAVVVAPCAAAPSSVAFSQLGDF